MNSPGFLLVPIATIVDKSSTDMYDNVCIRFDCSFEHSTAVEWSEKSHLLLKDCFKERVCCFLVCLKRNKELIIIPSKFILFK